MNRGAGFELWQRYVRPGSDITKSDPTAYMGHDSTPASQQQVNQVGNKPVVGCTKCWFIIGGIALLIWLNRR